MKYVRVMDGTKSNAGKFDYKIDEINVSENWDTSTLDPEKMGGFNFGIEEGDDLVLTFAIVVFGLSESNFLFFGFFEFS